MTPLPPCFLARSRNAGKRKGKRNQRTAVCTLHPGNHVIVARPKTRPTASVPVRFHRPVSAPLVNEKKNMETRASAPSSSWSEPDVAAEASASEGDSTSLKRSPQTAGLSGSERKRPANGGAAPALTVRTLTERQIEQRQKQIDHGKNTKGYDEYIRRVKKYAPSGT